MRHRLSALFNPSMFVALLALTLSLSSVSVAAVMISGKQIEKNTVTSAQIKNKTIKLKDISPKARGQLKGQAGAAGVNGANGLNGANGANGVNGAKGADSTDVVPSGRTITGSVYYRIDSSAVGQTLNQSVAFPAKAPAAVISASFAPDTVPASTQADPTCTGTYENPTAPAGKVCGYLVAAAVQTISLDTLEPGETLGFVVRTQAAAVGGITVDLSWAYTAP